MARKFQRVLHFLNPHVLGDRQKIAALRKKSHVLVIDEIADMIEELYKINHPETITSKTVSRKNVEQYKKSLIAPETDVHMFGTWVWYPWNYTLVHFLPENLHYTLLTARNKNLITHIEQKRFYESTIGIGGLSVGSAVAATIVHTGGGKFLRIADSDTISGSNINRMRTGFDTLGLSKTTVLGRELRLVNPYAVIDEYKNGLTPKNLEKFLTKPSKLTVVVDEMDTLYLKIQLRILARKYRIPVVMAADNGDGIVVDIERYDQDPALPLLNGDIPEKELLAISPSTPRFVAAKIISTWVKPENIDSRMKGSLLELGKTLYTWPQLGNAAFLAGAVMSYVVRKIIVGHPIRSGKYIIHPDTYFVPGYHSQEQKRMRDDESLKFRKILDL